MHNNKKSQVMVSCPELAWLLPCRLTETRRRSQDLGTGLVTGMDNGHAWLATFRMILQGRSYIMSRASFMVIEA